MKESIIASDDEDDLCSSKKRVSKEVLILGGLVLLVIGIIVLQQRRSAFEWRSSVAHADESARVENLCALKKSFADALREDGSQMSFAEDEACQVKKEVLANADVTSLEQEVTALVYEYPIAAMVQAIVRQDRAVAAFLVGIAKKESDWGKHVPQKEGKDCYNYWGYKGRGDRGEALGYACFASPEEAVRTVGGRLATLALTQHRDTPAKMIVWKCGSSCVTHSPESVKSWIGTVESYHAKLVTKKS